VSGVAAVQARIAEIEGRLLELRGAAAPSTASSTTATSFDSALGAALAAGGATANPTTAATGAAGGGILATGTATGAGLVEAARRYLGVPYVWGGEDTSGMDCSGLVQRAFADLGVKVPRVAREQMTLGTPVASLAQAVPGDLIVQRGGGHIGIYVGNGQMLHAPQAGDRVKIGPIYSTPTAIRRVLPAAAAAEAATTSASTALPALSPTAAADAARAALALAAGGAT
jgi:cell wall-associated NlpC family hydrolase